MKRDAYIVNTARGKICDRDAIARVLESGQLAGYAEDEDELAPQVTDCVAFWRNRDNRVRVGLRFYVFAAKGLSGSRCPAGRTTFLRFAGVWLRERGGWPLWVVRWGHFRRWWRGGVGEFVASCVPACGCGGEWFALLGCVGRLRRLGRQRQGEARID